MARNTSTKVEEQAASAADALVAELGVLEGDIETEVAEVTADVETLGGTSTGRIPEREYLIARGDKTLTPVRYLPRKLWTLVDLIPENAAFAGQDIVEDLLLTTGQRRFDRLFPLMAPTNPKDSLGFEVSREAAERSICLVFEGTDPARPMSGTMKAVSGLSVSTPSATEGKVVMPAFYVKNRVIVSKDGSAMTVICGARTSLSWGKTNEEQVYINVSAAATCGKRALGGLVGRERHVFGVVKRLSWVHAMQQEHEGSLSREAHLLTFAGLRNCYWGRSSENAKTSGMHASLAFVIDPAIRTEMKTDTYLWARADFNIG